MDSIIPHKSVKKVTNLTQNGSRRRIQPSPPWREIVVQGWAVMSVDQQPHPMNNGFALMKMTLCIGQVVCVLVQVTQHLVGSSVVLSLL